MFRVEGLNDSERYEMEEGDFDATLFPLCCGRHLRMP